jgi:hypothetical protein
MLTAELADNDGWQMLKELARELGNSALEKQCEKAFQEEQEHLENVRTWLSEMTLSEALGEDALLEADSADSERGTRKRKRSTSSRSSKSKKKRKQ